MSQQEAILVVILVLLAVFAAVKIANDRMMRHINWVVKTTPRNSAKYAGLDKAAEMQDGISHMAGYPVDMDNFIDPDEFGMWGDE